MGFGVVASHILCIPLYVLLVDEKLGFEVGIGVIQRGVQALGLQGFEVLGAVKVLDLVTLYLLDCLLFDFSNGLADLLAVSSGSQIPSRP